MAIPFVLDNGRNDDLVGRFRPEHLVWSDEFLNGTSPDPAKWRDGHRREVRPGEIGGQYKYQAGLNRHSSNVNQNADGSYAEGRYPDGKRHDGHYGEYLDQVRRIENGQLLMGGYRSNDPDPTAPEFHPNIPGLRLHPYTDTRYNPPLVADWRNKVFCSWLDTFGIARHGDAPPVVDPMSPRHAWRYGYYEGDFDFRDIITMAYRLSWWLMPYCNPEFDIDRYPLTPILYDSSGRAISGGTSVAGDNIARTGAEIDLFEVEFSYLRKVLQTLLMKVPLVGGREWGKANVIASDWGYVNSQGVPVTFDIRRGMVTIGLWWTPWGLQFMVNGVAVNRDVTRVPRIAQGFNLTREINSCVGVGVGGPEPYHPWRLDSDTGWLFGENAGCFLDNINGDNGKLSYIRVWQDPELNGEGELSNWKSPYNTSNAIDPSTPQSSIARYEGAADHGERYGVPLRYDPNGGTDSSFRAGDTSISISTATDDEFELRYFNGQLLWNANDRSVWEVFSHNVDNIDNPDDYVGQSNSPAFDVDRFGPGIYSVKAVDGGSENFVSSAAINVIIGSNSILPADVDVGGGGGGNFGTPVAGSGSSATSQDVVIDVSPMIAVGEPELRALARGINGFDTTGRTPIWSADPPLITFDPPNSLNPRLILDPSITDDSDVSITVDFDSNALGPIEITVSNFRGDYEGVS